MLKVRSYACCRPWGARSVYAVTQECRRALLVCRRMIHAKSGGRRVDTPCTGPYNVPFILPQDTTLGIDAVEYFKRSQIGGEALQTALGGGPLALRKTVTAEVDSLRQRGITPVFIFGGLWPAPVHHNGQW